MRPQKTFQIEHFGPARLPNRPSMLLWTHCLVHLDIVHSPQSTGFVIMPLCEGSMP